VWHRRPAWLVLPGMEGMLEPGGVRDSREDDNLESLNLADYQVRLASAAVAVQYLFTLHGQHDD
jgi:hypothetical protein